MTKSIFVAEMELKSGVNGADVEKFWVEEYLPTVSELSGYKVTLHKGDFGVRANQFLFIGHFESQERVGQLWQDKIPTAEMQQWMAANPAFQKLIDFFDEKWFVEFTQYADID